MKSRPISITIVSWYLIIANSLTLISANSIYNQPELIEIIKLNVIPINILLILIVVGVFINIVSAALMLKGKDIGRIIYIVWAIISLFISFFTVPSTIMMVPSLIIFMAITFILFRAKANEYFLLSQGEK